MKKPNKTFICKPKDGAEGTGMILVKDFNKIPENITKSSDYVVQEYLIDPLLLNNKKFDLRIYVLILDMGGFKDEPVISFIAEEAMVRFCTEDYERPTTKNMHHLLSHLTNYSLNKLSEKYVNAENLDSETQEDASKRTLTSIFSQLEKEQNINTA